MMGQAEVVLTGRVASDGSLRLDRRLDLPEGPVRIAVSPLSPEPPREDTLAVLARITAARKARSAPTRTAAEIDASIAEFRGAVLREFEETENLQADIARLREQG